ncbi:uncharacterized protein LOC134798603 [Cydia splendana]|uniref:uncharacterized protein LOC134798603 n=1 Tax=Cydia splendana TaxID=1100963 RepID=UPI00300C2D6D
MGKRSKRSKSKRKRQRSSSSSSSAISVSTERTPSTPPPKRNKVSRKADTQTVSTNNAPTLNNMIPEFNPLNDDVCAWLNIIMNYARTFSWKDEMIRFQALNKLKGPAKVWYDSLLRTDCTWPSWKWEDWNRKLTSSFQRRRNMFDLLKEIVENKPNDNQSLYEFFFEQKCKIDRLSLGFSEQDIISIIVGNIGDCGIGAAIEATNFGTSDNLASYLHGRVYKPSKNAKNVGAISRDVPPKSETQSSTSQNVSSSGSSVSPNVSDRSTTVRNNNTQQRKQIKCYNCGGNHTKANCDVVVNKLTNKKQCGYCNKQGHSESECYHKKNAVKIEKQETKFVSTPNPRNKFIKNIRINDFEHEAFVDSGSSCSLISSCLVKKLDLKKIKLPLPVTLHGYKMQNTDTVTHKITVDLKIDAVCLTGIDFYIMDDLADYDILIGRNVTERDDLMYSRVGNSLKFDYASSFKEFCNTVTDLELDADSHQNELIALFRKYDGCIAPNIKDLGKVNGHEMTINVTSPQPVQCRPFRASIPDRKIIREMVNELLENNIIRESKSPYASPALLVNKKN